MTYKQALAQARDGYRVREKHMGKGWTIGYFRKAKGFFCINPHTGSNYVFMPTSAEVASTDWETVS